MFFEPPSLLDRLPVSEPTWKVTTRMADDEKLTGLAERVAKLRSDLFELASDCRKFQAECADDIHSLQSLAIDIREMLKERGQD